MRSAMKTVRAGYLSVGWRANNHNMSRRRISMRSGQYSRPVQIGFQFVSAGGPVYGSSAWGLESWRRRSAFRTRGPLGSATTGR
jgi:hypothetical protein